MKDTFYWIFMRIHLIISIIIVVPTAIIYGSPSVLPTRLDIPVDTIDLANMLKAIMCLYLGFSVLWSLGIAKTHYWKIATQSNVLFMLTLASGRLLSMMLDGIPTGGYIFGVIAELLIGMISIYQLRRYSRNRT